MQLDLALSQLYFIHSWSQICQNRQTQSFFNSHRDKMASELTPPTQKQELEVIMPNKDGLPLWHGEALKAV